MKTTYLETMMAIGAVQAYLSPEEYITLERKAIPDRGEKLSHYTQIESLKEYILVSQDRVYVERYLRKQEEWGYTTFQKLNGVLPITSIQCELPLQDIYERVTFPQD